MAEIRRPWTAPTLATVAARAGVSKATASRVLARAGDPQAVLPAAASDVIRAAQAVGYRRTEPTRPRLLVLTSDITRTGYWLTLSGVLTACQDLEVDLSVQVITGSAKSWCDIFMAEHRGRVDGLVVLEFDSLSAAVLPHLPVDMPVAVAGGYPQSGADPLPRAWVDDRAGAVLAAKHLLELGHKRIAYVGVPSAGHPDPRLAGWRQVLSGAGLDTPAPLATGWGASTGLRAAPTAARSGATAVLCGNDDLAVGLIAGLRAQGLDVPGDVSVIGVDDHPHAVATSPALTTVRLDFAQVGELAARLALGVESGPVIEVATQLVLRESTAPPGAT